MHIHFSLEVRDDILPTLSDRVYQRLWDALDRIAADPETAPRSYVSSRQVFGTKVPGTDYTVFWRIFDGEHLWVMWLLEDAGL